ncbi:MAG: hypothetical protein EA399_09990 [Desulfovibrionales bacterium]|nr:MAG: hypothetical protein EA399_09990 [Desulfovibrionales bacterium]
MNTEPIQAGSSIESACRKCKTVTDHHVVVMLDGQIGKVQCKVCGGQHAHRPPKEAATPKAPAQPRTAGEKTKKTAASKKTVVPKKPSPEVLALWESKISAVSPADIRTYAMTDAFQEGEVISHATFGQGYVQRLIKPNMIEVLFEDGVKLLRCCAEPAGAPV